MTELVLATAILFTPARTAETVPAGELVLHVDGGVALLHVGVPVLPVAPILTGDLELAWGVFDGLELRGRYRSDLGVVHRIGPEVRARVAGGFGWAVAARLWASGQVVGAVQDDFEVGGDVATQGAALVTRRYDFGAVTLDAGVTIQWLLYERLADRSNVDHDPYLLSVDLALEVEWPTSADSNLSLRLEVAVPTAPDDPFTLAGFQPRVVFGGSLTP